MRESMCVYVYECSYFYMNDVNKVLASTFRYLNLNDLEFWCHLLNFVHRNLILYTPQMSPPPSRQRTRAYSWFNVVVFSEIDE
jgi:hypothetical protein